MSVDYLSRRVGYKNYNEYLKSEHWKCIIQYYKDSKCFCCRNKNNLQLHHINYLNLGNENCDDLVTLCGGCHITTHKIIKGGMADYKNAHIIIRKNINNEVNKYTKLVNWHKLQNKSKHETIYQLRCFLESFGLLDNKCNATDKAFDMGLAVKTEDNKIKWCLYQYVKYKQAYNKYIKSNGNLNPIVIKLIEELGITFVDEI